MGGILANVAVVMLFIVLGGVFAAAEMSLVSLRESQVKALQQRGPRGETVARLVRDPNRFLSAGQVGATVSGFLSASFGATTLADRLSPHLVAAGLHEGAAHWVSVIGLTLVVSYLSIVLSELTAKRLALAHAESIAMVLGPVLDRLARVFRPVIWLLGASTNLVVRLFGGDPNVTRAEMTEAELRELVAGQSGIDADERRILGEVLDAGTRAVVEVMVPRPDVRFVSASMRVADASELVRAQPHSRYPVTRRSSDDVIGFVHVRDLFDPAVLDRPGARVGDLVRPLLMVPGTARLVPVLSQMRLESVHMAVVLDEYGGTDGIVTMEDLVEELVGEIRDEFDAEPSAVLVRPGSIEVDGMLNLSDFAEATGLVLPDGPYETAAGYVVARLGRLPIAGDDVVEGDSRLEVAGVDGRRIARLRVTRRSEETDTEMSDTAMTDPAMTDPEVTDPEVTDTEMHADAGAAADAGSRGPDVLGEAGARAAPHDVTV